MVLSAGFLERRKAVKAMEADAAGMVATTCTTMEYSICPLGFITNRHRKKSRPSLSFNCVFMLVSIEG